MSEVLGIHISDRGIVGVIADAQTDADPIVLELGENDLAAATAVAAGPDGAVLVGDAAARADGPIVTDPLGRARGGRTGALTAVFTHVTGRAAMVTGSAPTKLAVVVGDDFDSDARDQIALAANAAGFSDVTMVFETLALARRPDVVGQAAVAAGAALTASAPEPPPIVTREDLGEGVATPQTETPAPVEPTTGSVSVFDSDAVEEPEPEVVPVRSAPAPVESRPITTPTAQVSPPIPPAAPPLAHDAPERSVPIGAVIVVVLIVLIGAVAGGIYVLGGGDDSATNAADGLVATSSSTTPSTTSAAISSTTSAAISSTSSSTSSSTTSSTSSSTTSSSTTSTTTIPVRVGTPGPVTLVETGLQFDNQVVVQFGQDSEIVLEEAAAVLGDPDSDTGFEPHEFCAGTRTRFVRWGDLELVFTEEVADTAEGVFGQWYTDGHSRPTGLVTLGGLGESATVGFLEVTFGNAVVIVAAFEGDTAGIFAVTNPDSGGVLSGTTEGLHPEGVVTTLWAGDSCTRAFT